MKKNIENKVTVWKVPDSIIEHYTPYRNQSDKFKISVINKTFFEVDEKYEIIDLGKLFFNKT